MEQEIKRIESIVLEKELKKKIAVIRKIFNQKSVLIAFSGGIDSTLVCYFAVQYASRAKAVLIRSQLTPSIEIEQAEQYSKSLNIPFEIVDFDALAIEKITENTSNRCYHCKQTVLQTLEDKARVEKFDLVVDGTNYSDLSADRPGLRALDESRAQSPLAEAKISKPEIIALTEMLNLPSINIPPQACLASRIPFDLPLSKDLLEMVDRAEHNLRNILGEYKEPLRVRVQVLHPSKQYMARIELVPSLFERVLHSDIRAAIHHHFIALGFAYVTLDLHGFASGSMHNVLPQKITKKVRN